MSKIREDFVGLYVVGGGYIVRPKGETTRFKKDDCVKVHHFGGSSVAGVGDFSADFRKKDGFELWRTTMATMTYKAIKKFYSNEEFERLVTLYLNIELRFDVELYQEYKKIVDKATMAIYGFII